MLFITWNTARCSIVGIESISVKAVTLSSLRGGRVVSLNEEQERRMDAVATSAVWCTAEGFWCKSVQYAIKAVYLLVAWRLRQCLGMLWECRTCSTGSRQALQLANHLHSALRVELTVKADLIACTWCGCAILDHKGSQRAEPHFFLFWIALVNNIPLKLTDDFTKVVRGVSLC